MNSFQKLNICLISAEYPPETGFGGIGTYTYHLAHGLVKNGHKVSVITKTLNKEQAYSDKGVKIYRNLDKKLPIRGVRRLANILSAGKFNYWLHSRSVFLKMEELISQSNKFDIIEGPLWDGECLAYSSKLRIPLVVRLQTPIFKVREILNLKANKNLEYIEKESLKKATFIASISHNISELIINKYKVSPKKIIHSPLGISFPKINKAVFKGNSYKLLHVSRLEKRKGTKELIDALPVILSSNKKITVDLVGKDFKQAPGGISYFEYFKKIVPVSLQSRVTFHGFINKSKLQSFYKNCDVFILPSRYESFGLVFLEAMGYGKPVIGTKTGGIEEIIKDDDTGLLIDVNSSDQIADAILKIFNNPLLRKKLGQQAFNFVRSNFNVENMVESTLNIYYRAIEEFSTTYEKSKQD